MAAKKISRKTASVKKSAAKKKAKAVKKKTAVKTRKTVAKAPVKKKKTAAKKAVAKVSAVPKKKPIDNAAYELAKTIVDAIHEKKGENLVCLDLRNIENRVCDFFIICEGNSSTQIDAIGESVEFKVKNELGERPYRSEGWDNALWILIDYVNVIVHVFDRETRAFYNLESLWADAEKADF